MNRKENGVEDVERKFLNLKGFRLPEFLHSVLIISPYISTGCENKASVEAAVIFHIEIKNKSRLNQRLAIGLNVLNSKYFLFLLS